MMQKTKAGSVLSIQKHDKILYLTEWLKMQWKRSNETKWLEMQWKRSNETKIHDINNVTIS